MKNIFSGSGCGPSGYQMGPPSNPIMNLVDSMVMQPILNQQMTNPQPNEFYGQDSLPYLIPLFQDIDHPNVGEQLLAQQMELQNNQNHHQLQNMNMGQQPLLVNNPDQYLADLEMMNNMFEMMNLQHPLQRPHFFPQFNQPQPMDPTQQTMTNSSQEKSIENEESNISKDLWNFNFINEENPVFMFNPEVNPFQPEEGKEDEADALYNEYSKFREEAKLQQEQEQSKAMEELNNAELRNTTDNIITALESSNIQKFKNSKFLKFLKKLNTGAYKIDSNNNTLLKNKELLKQFHQSQNQDQLPFLQNHGQESIRGPFDLTNDEYAEIWNEIEKQSNIQNILQTNKDEELEELDQEIENALQDLEHDDKLSQEFDEAIKEVYEENKDISQEDYSEYNFHQTNHYLLQNLSTTSSSLFQQALALIKEGKNHEAILALEAEVQKANNNAEAWRLLGILNAENDEDHPAIAAFIKAVQADNKNADCLLSLGISCINVFEREESIQYFFNFIKFHPKYSHLIQKNEINILSNANVSVQMKDLINIFHQSLQINSNDSDLWAGLGALNFSVREFDSSISCFKNAIRLKPEDHSLWNRLGATYANYDNPLKSVDLYKVALELKPNYPRAWINMGIAYSNSHNYIKAIECFLTGISLNPNAYHVWEYLEKSFDKINRNDLKEKIPSLNPNAFSNEFSFINSGGLPKPNSEIIKSINFEEL